MKIILKPGKGKNIISGYPWIFRGEIQTLDGNIQTGELVKVYSYQNIFLGVGYLNLASKIVVRMLDREDTVIDQTFFEKRIENAVKLRKDLGIYDACRLIFSEADLLPGLVVDKYNDYLVLEIATAGMERRRDLIIEALKKVIKPLGIYERSDTASRGKEGLEPVKGFIGPAFPLKQEIEENGFKLLVDLEGGQKTGHFFDQRFNRLLLKQYVKDKEVLDLCCHTGSFSIHASGFGAKQVTSVDISSDAINSLITNAKLNQMTNIKPVNDDVFVFLQKAIDNKETYDVVVLDPPAFTKNKDSLPSAYKGYIKANSMALKVVKNGGYLFTFSCSGHLTIDLFLEMLKDATTKANCKTQLIDFRLQASDHPVLPSALDNLYLKCAVLRVIK